MTVSSSAPADAEDGVDDVGAADAYDVETELGAEDTGALKVLVAAVGKSDN